MSKLLTIIRPASYVPESAGVGYELSVVDRDVWEPVRLCAGEL